MSGTNGIRSAGGCLCAAWLLALFALVSPYWMWRRSYYNTGWSWYSASSTYAVGNYIASYTSGSVPCYCGWGWATCRCTVTSQWNDFSAFNKTMCSTTLGVQTSDGGPVVPFYTLVGQYGWCTAADGDIQIPSANNSTWILSTCAVVLLFAATCISFASPHAGKSKTAFVGSVFAFIGCTFTVAAFAVACGSDYNQSFGGSGGYLPISQEGLLSVTGPVYMYWGPGFWCMIVAFLCSLAAAIYILTAAKTLDNDIDGGNYGAGADYGGGAYPPYQDPNTVNQPVNYA